MYEPVGYYLDCDTAVCEDCFDPVAWEGFEDWDEPLTIFDSDEADTPTHCAECESLIEHALTSDGYAYVREAYLRALLVEDGRKCIVRAWVEAYLIEDEDALEAVEDWELVDAYSPAA